MWSRLYREHPYVPSRDPLRAIPPSRHPFQVLVLIALVVSGLANFFTPGSEVLQENLTPWAHKVWAFSVTVSAMVALASAWWPDRVTGLLMERIGLWTLGVSCPIYAIVVYAQSRFDLGIPGVTLTLFLGIASAWRAVHVNRELKILRHFVDKFYR